AHKWILSAASCRFQFDRLQASAPSFAVHGTGWRADDRHEMGPPSASWAAFSPCSSKSYCTATVTSVFQVMSTLSPTLTLSNTVGSTICRLYFQPFGPEKVIEDALLSIASTVTVIVLCTVAVPPGRVCWPAVVVVLPVSTGASPGGFSLAETLLLYVSDTLSPTLSSSKRFAPAGTSIVSNLPSAVLMFTTRLA